MTPKPRTTITTKGPEHVEDPVVAGDELRADGDHDAAHYERAKDAPEQHAVLIDARNPMKAKIIAMTKTLSTLNDVSMA